MTRKQIKAEFPNEVDLFRTTLADVKLKLPGLDEFLSKNPECTKCSNSKDYHCVQFKGKPGCRTCTSRRISCSRHVQYLVETTARLLEWSVETTMTMYDKYVKQTRTGKKSMAKVKKVAPSRKAMVAPQSIGSGSAVDQTISGRRKNVAAPEEDDSGAELSLREALRIMEELDGSSDEPDVEEYDDQDIEWNESTTNNISQSISNTTSRTSPSKPRAFPSDPQEETSASGSQITLPVVESERAASLDRDSVSLQIDSEKPLSTSQTSEGQHDSVVAAVSGAQNEHAPESSMSAEQRIKQLEEKVAKLNALRLIDASSISRLTNTANTAFDNMSVLSSRVHMHRQELGTILTKHIETAHQQPFKSLIDKMDETSVSATQILKLLDKRKKDYVMLQTRVPVVITDEEGCEWVPWDVISDDDSFQDTETEKKRGRDDEADGEGSSKRRKC